MITTCVIQSYCYITEVGGSCLNSLVTNETMEARRGVEAIEADHEIPWSRSHGWSSNGKLCNIQYTIHHYGCLKHKENQTHQARATKAVSGIKMTSLVSLTGSCCRTCKQLKLYTCPTPFQHSSY